MKQGHRPGKADHGTQEIETQQAARGALQAYGPVRQAMSGAPTPAGQRRSRLREPSTWAGVAVLASQVGQILQAGNGSVQMDPASLGAIVAAIAAMAMRESPRRP